MEVVLHLRCYKEAKRDGGCAAELQKQTKWCGGVKGKGVKHSRCIVQVSETLGVLENKNEGADEDVHDPLHSFLLKAPQIGGVLSSTE